MSTTISCRFFGSKSIADCAALKPPLMLRDLNWYLGSSLSSLSSKTFGLLGLRLNRILGSVFLKSTLLSESREEFPGYKSCIDTSSLVSKTQRCNKEAALERIDLSTIIISFSFSRIWFCSSVINSKDEAFQSSTELLFPDYISLPRFCRSGQYGSPSVKPRPSRVPSPRTIILLTPAAILASCNKVA